MRELMPFTASRPAFGITPETAGLLCRISPAAIGRHLKTDKAALKVKGESLTKSLDSLSSRIPIRTFYSGAERKTPGFRQTGTVRRCGQAAQGRYAYTLTATEVSSGWIALYSLLNNAHKWTFEALSDLKASSLLPIREFRSDNGSEFINSAAESWRRQERLAFTRSRGRKKNDNCFDGQKNGAAVREYAGYDRLAGCEEQALPAAVCRPLVPLLSFFMPAQKLTSKTRIGSKEIKVYDRPRSPFQRLSESEELPGQIKDALAAQCALYNPVELQHSVNKAILRLRQRLAQVNRIQTQERL
ncbi:MAG: transposase family protein [Treponema sp.]|nr:transposase family protein [Treponema sp.]